MSAEMMIRAGEAVACRPVPRHLLTPDAWRAMSGALAAQPELGFVALWADPAQVHALFWCGGPLLASVPVEAGLYAALSAARPGAALFERMVADLWGHQAADARDLRPWLDHGTWPLLRPLAERPVPNTGAPDIPEMLPAPEDPSSGGAAHDVLGFGPLPPGLAGPAHWRAAVEGNRVRQLEARLGYGHRGVLGLMRGKSPAGAARLAARIDGAATVAHATAFARAVEAAQQTPVPPRALALRGVLLAIERVAVGLHDIHATAEACGLDRPALQQAREDVLAACGAALGHRLMMDLVRPGGVQAEPGAEALGMLDAALAAVPGAPAPRSAWWTGQRPERWPKLGGLPVADALALAPAGVVGRAAGRPDPAHPAAEVLAAGDLPARMRLRRAALASDVAAARAGLAAVPEGPVLVPLSHDAGEGLGWAEGPQGMVWHWVRLANGTLTASFAADPVWLHLPAFEAAATGASLDELPMVAASFGLHLAGMEL